MQFCSRINATKRSRNVTLAAVLAAALMAAPQAVTAATFQYTGSGALYDVVDFGGSPFSVGDSFSFNILFDSDRPFNSATDGVFIYTLDVVQANFVIDSQQVYSTNGGPGVTLSALVGDNVSGQDVLSVSLSDSNDPNFAFANVAEDGDESILTSLDLISAFQADFNGPITFRLEDFGFASFVEGSVINRTFTRLDSVAPIPLPPALALLLSGFGILSVMRYRGKAFRASAKSSAYMTMPLLCAAMLLGAPQTTNAATYQYTVSGTLDLVRDLPSGVSPFSIGDSFEFELIFDEDRPDNTTPIGNVVYSLDVVESRISIGGQEVFSAVRQPTVYADAVVIDSDTTEDGLSFSIFEGGNPGFFSNIGEYGNSAILASVSLLSAFRSEFETRQFRFRDEDMYSFVEGTISNRTFVQFDNVAPVPLPPALALLISGLGILGAMRYRGKTATG